jgi:magnesium-transporting ATPase (P-type)
MGRTGTDVAREASDIVLADDNFATITAAVEEGRVVFANIRKVTFFLLSTAVGEVITILVALLVGWPLPFVAAQILWINLVTNGVQDVALAFEPGEPGLLEPPPRPRGEGLVTLRLLERLGGGRRWCSPPAPWGCSGGCWRRPATSTWRAPWR